MSSRRPSSRTSARARIENFLAVLIPLVLCGVTVADFLRDGHIDKYLIGALMVFGLASLGYRIDTIIEKYLEGRSPGRQGNGGA